MYIFPFKLLRPATQHLWQQPPPPWRAFFHSPLTQQRTSLILWDRASSPVEMAVRTTTIPAWWKHFTRPSFKSSTNSTFFFYVAGSTRSGCSHQKTTPHRCSSKSLYPTQLQDQEEDQQQQELPHTIQQLLFQNEPMITKPNHPSSEILYFFKFTLP